MNGKMTNGFQKECIDIYIYIVHIRNIHVSNSRQFLLDHGNN